MELEGGHVGLTVTGSFCIFAKIEQEIRYLKETGAVLHPILSESVQSANSRSRGTGEFMGRTTAIMETKPILETEGTEPTGPKRYLDVLLIAPCTGSTLAELANGVTDVPVLMATRARLRNGRSLVISVSINDTLGINLKNVGLLFDMRNIYFISFDRGNLVKKLTSMIARIGPIENTLKEALEDRQVQPVT